MIEEFGYERLQRRLEFLRSRAKAHRLSETDRQWHVAAAATLSRDAAAIAMMLDDIETARALLQDSGDLFLDLGFLGGLQLLYIAGDRKNRKGRVESELGRFANALHRRTERREGERFSGEAQFGLSEESFTPPQLLRIYQALAGGGPDDEHWYGLRKEIRKALELNAVMPVGPTRMTLASYLATLDQLTEVDPVAPPGGVNETLRSLAHRRQELLSAARRDSFHWKALVRPAELIDFDLLALLLAGVRHGQASDAISAAFAGRDPMTALPKVLAESLSRHTD
jgi:hypothetical protein